MRETMLALDMTPATVIVGLLVAALAALALRRLARNGTCDCHKGDVGGSACGGGCAGCSGCAAADRMAADLERL